MSKEITTLFTLFQTVAQKKGSAILFSDEVERCSGTESISRVDALAGELQSLGISQGDRIAFICNCSVRHVLMYFACQQLAAIPCALHVRNTPAGIDKTLKWLDASLLIIDCVYQDMAMSALAIDNMSLPMITLSADDHAEIQYSDMQRREDQIAARVEHNVEAPAMIILSSGTTGEPKGIVHSQKTLFESAMAGTEVFGQITDKDSVLVTMSPSFAAWNHVTLAHLAHGARLVFNNCFDPDMFLQTLDQERISNTALVPTAWRRIIQCMSERFDLSALKLAFFSGEPGTSEFIKMMQQKLPQCEVRTAYLTSEGGAAAACVADPEVLAANISSVGKPVSGAAIRLVEEDGSIDDEVAAGETGEILQRGGSIALGYWNNTELNGQKFVKGWWRSGDLGYLDENGYLVIVGRADNMIITGGLKVHAEEIEATLMQHPAISLAAIVGKPDAKWGQRIEAFVVCNTETSMDNIIAWCRERALLPSFKLPKKIHFCDSLPTGATGKIYRRGLLETTA